MAGRIDPLITPESTAEADRNSSREEITADPVDIAETLRENVVLLIIRLPLFSGTTVITEGK